MSGPAGGARAPLFTFEQVYRAVGQVPPGFVVTYGQVAAALGDARGARTVGWALRALPEGRDVPWHRVINARGRITTRGRGSDEIARQRHLLKEEGVAFGPDGRVDLAAFRWPGPFYL